MQIAFGYHCHCFINIVKIANWTLFPQNIQNYIKLDCVYVDTGSEKKSQLTTIDKVQCYSIFKKNHISLRYHVHSYDMVDTFP